MNRAHYHAHRVLNRYLLPGVRDRKDILAMQALAPLSAAYLPWSPTAMRPSAVLALLNDIMVNGRRRVVELGGGVSTFYLGRLLGRVGGQLYTVEHDEKWAEVLDRQLRGENLAGTVTVVHAPLAPTTHGWAGREAHWYSEDKLRHLWAAGGIDLLLVDGPPAYQRGSLHARYPAVPFFADALATTGYTVVLDDIDRRGEQEILRQWQAELGIAFERRFIHGTIAVGRSDRSLTT